MMMHIYYISIGSNHDASQNIRVTMSLLGAVFPDIRFSTIMRTRGVFVAEDCWYLNAVAKITSRLAIGQIAYALKCIEKQMGRKRNSADVSVDLDILVCDGNVVSSDFLKFPFLNDLKTQVDA